MGGTAAFTPLEVTGDREIAHPTIMALGKRHSLRRAPIGSWLRGGSFRR